MSGAPGFIMAASPMAATPHGSNRHAVMLRRQQQLVCLCHCCRRCCWCRWVLQAFKEVKRLLAKSSGKK